ncbi:MAG: DUF7594 domain-containing protein [Acidimicrobiales bacterium]
MRKSRVMSLAVGTALALVAVGTVVAPEAGAQSTTATFAAVADGAVDVSTSNGRYGDPKELIADASPVRSSYLRFAPSGLGPTVERAVLRVHVRDKDWAPSPSAGSVAAVGSTTWTEAGLTYATRPATGAVVATPPGPAVRLSWVEFDVTSIVRQDGPVSMAITSANADGVAYDARETGALGPQLVVTTSEPPPTTTTTTTTTTAPAPTTATSTLSAVADAPVDASLADLNQGSVPGLTAGAGPDRSSYVRFDLTAITGRITKAQLRLHVGYTADAASAAGGSFKLVPSTTWSESGLTWQNRPAFTSELWKLGAVGRNRWVTMDVSWATRPGQRFGAAVVSTNADTVIYDSRETGANGPQLVVTYEVAPPAQADTLYAVGDIAKCNTQGDEATSALLDGTTGTIVTLGDNAYPDGSAANFSDCFDPSWGRHKARIKPATGNHEYQTSPTATPYFDYFGGAAGDPTKGYYSYDIGSWHIVALNSDCARVGGCVAGSLEEQWLRADLAATAKPCLAAYWHYPLFTSSAESAPTQTMQPFWQALYDAGADLILNGHAHGYERFALQSPSGAADPARGIREIVAATGGADLYPFADTPAANSEVRENGTWGVLKLTLNASGYDWRFLPVTGKTFTDQGSTACH